MTATRIQDSTQRTPVLYLAFELGWNEWKLAFAQGEDILNYLSKKCET